jgi:hypothetical protein
MVSCTRPMVRWPQSGTSQQQSSGPASHACTNNDHIEGHDLLHSSSWVSYQRNVTRRSRVSSLCCRGRPIRGDHWRPRWRNKLSRALSRYEKHRNRETYPALDWTLGLTCLRGINEMEERLFTAIGTDQREASAFFGMITGVVPMGSFFSPPHLIRLIGVKDFLRLACARSR